MQLRMPLGVQIMCHERCNARTHNSYQGRFLTPGNRMEVQARTHTVLVHACVRRLRTGIECIFIPCSSATRHGIGNPTVYSIAIMPEIIMTIDV